MPITELFGDDVPFTSTGTSEDYFLRALNVLSADVTVFSFGDFSSNTFFVSGQIFSTAAGIRSGDGNSNLVVVNTTGVINGGTTAIAMNGTNSSVVNYGDIVGAFNGVTFNGASSVTLSNTGDITGSFRGISVTGDTQIFYVDNSGNVSATLGAGIYLDEQSGNIINTGNITARGFGIDNITSSNTSTDVVEILNSGVISGAAGSVDGSIAAELVYNEGLLQGAVFLNGGDDRIDTRSGLVSGDIDLGAGDDVAIGSREGDTITAGEGNDIVRAGGGNDDVTGGDGNDELRGAGGDDYLLGESDADMVFGGTGDDIVRGNAGDDILRGGMGDDRVFGGSGDDEINGGRGDDLLVGNSGADVFIFGATAGNDTITDFRVNLDTIDLSALGTRFNRVDAATEVVNGNAIIDLDMLGGDGTIVVRGVGGNLDANDFIF